MSTSTGGPSRVAVIGTGYVGLTTGVGLASLGHSVTCVDVDPRRVKMLAAGEVPFFEPGLREALQDNLQSGRLKVTLDFDAAVAAGEVIFITVGTPDADGRIDLSQVLTAADRIGAVLRQQGGYKVVTVKSTVVPGTTSGAVRRQLEESSGMRAGDFGLCMNPEFLREGSALDDFMHPDRIVIGQWDERSGLALARLYANLDCPRIMTTPSNAEAIKYAANALLATLISFSNEMAAVCEATDGTDVDTVLSGVHLDRRWMPFAGADRVRPGILSFLWAGCGFGGSCLPKDVNALREYARDLGVEPKILDAVATVNRERPARLLALIGDALGSLAGAEIAILGLAFKAETDDLRAAPALSLAQRLIDSGAKVRAFDPIVEHGAAIKALDGRVRLCERVGDAFAGADAVIVVTPHAGIRTLDWGALGASMRRRIVFDARNALDVAGWPRQLELIRIGRRASS